MSLTSDGDTKTIEALLESKPYGCKKVRKDECVNHVAKRMGKGLRNLVETKRKQKIKPALGGKGVGKLTEKKIVRLQRYYKKAILSNDSVDGMYKAIWATFYHCISTDAKPQHADCPAGKKSYCFYQRAIAAKAKEMPLHTETSQQTKLSPDVGKHVREVYERLSDVELLRGCLERKTQNVNESIHAVIWKFCPKHLFVQRQRFEIGVALGVAEYNMGAKGTHLFFEKLGLRKNAESERQSVKRDYLRVRKAERAVTEKVKKARVKVRNARAEIERQIELLQKVKMEGDIKTV